MNQNLSSYRIFYTVANTGNISKAAKELYISQPRSANPSRSWRKALAANFFPEVPAALF